MRPFEIDSLEFDIDSLEKVPLNPMGSCRVAIRRRHASGILPGDNMAVQPDDVLDARGLPCPLPLLKAKQALSRLAPGQLLEVMATDAGSWRDFESFVELSVHEMPAREERGDVYHFWIRKCGEPAP